MEYHTQSIHILNMMYLIFCAVLLFSTPVLGTSLDNTFSDNCIVSLTIPKESIKSSCNVNDAMQRKLQSLEAQSVQLRNKIRAVDIRLPQLATRQIRYASIVDRLDLTVAQIGTYYKRLEDRLEDLEIKASRDDNDMPNLQNRINSPDTLLDPIRPMLMAELEAFKASMMKSIAASIVPKLLDPTDSLGADFKKTIIESLRQQILPSLLEPSDEIGSSSDITEILETTSHSASTESSVYEQMTMSTSQKNSVLGSLARTLKNATSDNQNENKIHDEKNSKQTSDEVIKENATNPEDTMTENSTAVYATENSTAVYATENSTAVYATDNNTTAHVSEKSTMGYATETSTINLTPLSDFTEYIQHTKELIEKETQKLKQKYEQSIGNIKTEFTEAIQNITGKVAIIGRRDYNNTEAINQTLIEMKRKLAALDRKYEKPRNDFAVNNIIEKQMQLEGSNIQKKLTNRMMILVNSLETKIEQQNRKINMSTSLVNIYKQTLVNFQNESKVTMKSIESKVMEIQRKIEEKNNAKNRNDEMEERLRYLEDEIQAVADSQLFTEQNVDVFKKRATENDREAQNKIRQLTTKINKLEFEINLMEKLKVSIRRQDAGLNGTSEKVKTLLKDMMVIQEKFKVSEVERLSKDTWVQYNFTDNSRRNSCTSTKYIRQNKIGMEVAKYVGVQLCSAYKYKIFLGKTLEETFLDIGDTYGHGHDHCQFVGATDPNGSYQVDKSFKVMNGISAAYLRKGWNEVPRKGKLSLMRPTPSWYMCGVSIP